MRLTTPFWSLGFFLTCLFVLGSTLPAPAYAQGGTDVIRGQVTDSAKKPIANAVVVMMDSTGTRRESRTNKEGRYSIFFPNGSGVYIIQVTSVGMAPSRQQIRRVADEAVLIADFTMGLSRVAQKQAQDGKPALEAVNVVAQKRKKGEKDPSLTGKPGDSEELLLGSSGRGVPPGQQGDLNQMAGSMPGVVLTPNGYSILGMGADQNNTTLNGLQFSGAGIPRAANVVGGVTTSTFDPARGGFSGGQVSLSLRSGSNFISRRMMLALDMPQLQFSDATSRRLGQQFTNARLSWGGTGPIIINKLFYNLSWDLGRRSSDLQALGLDEPGALQRLGVSSDSVSRLFDLLNASGVPTQPGRPPRASATNQLSVLSRIDYIPPKSSRSFSMTASASLDRSDGSMVSPNAVLAHGGKASTGSWMLQLSSVGYFKEAFLNELQTSASWNTRRNSAYLTLPDGRVRVVSDLPDGNAGNSTLSFGGNSGLPNDNKTWSWEVLNQTSWYSMDNQHSLTLSLNARLEGMSQSQFQNRYGTYTYNSLADFENGTPTSFTRTFGGNRTGARLWQFAASFGDRWRKTSDLQFQYGVRVEGNRYLTAPQYNPTLDSLLGVRTDRVPNSFSVIPRIGFLWNYKPQKIGRPFEVVNSGGVTSSTVAYTPASFLNGGIGIFRNGFSPTLVSGLLGSTGLPNAQQQLICLGSEIPVPDWDLFASDLSAIPSQCLSGTLPGPFATTAPFVRLFGENYTAPRSVRANIAWSFPVFNFVNLRLEETYSIGLRQSNVVDLNFSNTERFVLSQENNRPVFVAPEDIVASTGAVSLNASRRFTEFSRVQSTVSDLRSVSNQFRVSLTSITNQRRSWYGSASYVLSHNRSQGRGFSSSTVGNPFDVEWGRGDIGARHQFNMSFNRTFKYLTASLYSNIFSGQPYTPLVGGDINGDGSVNDRAFIFDPTTIHDTVIAAGMQSLLRTLRKSDRVCLTRQLDRLAERNSCEGPWRQSVSGSINLSGKALRTTDRLNVSLFLYNILGGLDQLFHGSRGLHGWGETTFPDRTLLTPVGFDAANNQFRYQVNPRFADTRPARNVFRSPFQITLNASFRLGPSQEEQVFRMSILRTADQADSATRIRLVQGMFVNQVTFPFQYLLEMRDSLRLSPDQRGAVIVLLTEYRTKMDTLWAPFSERLAALGLKARLREEKPAMDALREQSLKALASYGVRMRTILTPEQWLGVGEPVKMLFMGRVP